MNESAVPRSPCTHVGHGVRIALDWDYHRLAHTADQAIADLTANYPRAATLYVRVLASGPGVRHARGPGASSGQRHLPG